MPSIFSSKRTREKISKENVFISYSDTLATIDFSYLELLKIEGIILDLDNTIISEDDQYVSPHAEDWIKQAKELNINLFLLSNGKRKKRVEYWSNRLNIPAISPAKKPCSPAIHAALKYMNLSPEKVVVIGDSLHTDILGAWLVGCQSIQVASLPHPPRWWEKLFGQLLQTPYPTSRLELWPFLNLNCDSKN